MGCTSLASVVIPKHIAKIENSTFRGCISLVSIIIPKNVEKIGIGAFSGCVLTSVELPKTLKKIGEAAFLNCSSIIIKAINPPSILTYTESKREELFSSSAKLFVPKESVDKYKCDIEWGKYNIQPMDDNMSNNEREVEEEKGKREEEKRQGMERNKERYVHVDENYDDFDPYEDVYSYDAYAPYRNDKDWLSEVAGTDDPEVMNDVHWNMD